MGPRRIALLFAPFLVLVVALLAAPAVMEVDTGPQNVLELVSHPADLPVALAPAAMAEAPELFAFFLNDSATAAPQAIARYESASSGVGRCSRAQVTPDNYLSQRRASSVDSTARAFPLRC